MGEPEGGSQRWRGVVPSWEGRGPPAPPATDTQHLEGGGDPERAGGGSLIQTDPRASFPARRRCTPWHGIDVPSSQCAGACPHARSCGFCGGLGALIDVEANQPRSANSTPRRRSESPTRERGSHRVGFMATDPCPHAPPTATHRPQQRQGLLATFGRGSAAGARGDFSTAAAPDPPPRQQQNHRSAPCPSSSTARASVVKWAAWGRRRKEAAAGGHG